MSEVSRIFVVEGDEGLNRNLVNSLRKEGYGVQGVMSGMEAVRALWSEEYDVVICDLKTPGADGFELLQWLRAYRPNTRMILVGSSGSDAVRMQALENGAASYLEKPLDFRVLKEELRRLVQQTGFSANLDSFDLLDVIQIVTMSRKTIALVVNTGVEERGVLRFQNGELVWAEYGMLLGEEAFFALAAHKNGTVLHQPWNGRIVSNVTQPLSRLILQALQYRAKYAHGQQHSGKHESVVLSPLLTQDEDDDRPFVFVEENLALETPQDEPVAAAINSAATTESAFEKEWWERTGSIPINDAGKGGIDGIKRDAIEASPTIAMSKDALTGVHSNTIVPASVHKTPASQRTDLPSWLTEQPTASGMPAIRPSSLSDSARMPAAPAGPSTTPRSSSPNWPPQNVGSTTEQVVFRQGTPSRDTLSVEARTQQASPGDWPLPEQAVQKSTTSDLQSISQAARASGPLPADEAQPNGAISMPEPATTQHSRRRSYNYSALVSALQTLGYSIKGFIATAIVSMEGQPITQVAVDDLDISQVCKHLSATLKGVLHTLAQEQWGDYGHMVISSSGRYILMRIVGDEKNVFQVLITTREADPMASLEVMANVEGAISAALR